MRLVWSWMVCVGLACGCGAGKVAGRGGGGGDDTEDLAMDPEGPTDLARSFNRDSACANVMAAATLARKPVDVIVIIDNSGSMTDKIVAVQNNINVNFAAIIGASGLDYRVILLSEHGSAFGDQSICISKPLSGNPSCSPPPGKPMNGPRFFHYSDEISSHNSLSRLLAAYVAPDPSGAGPMGLSGWLRPDAFRVILEITDDSSDLTADAFETALFALMPPAFGTGPMDRNYLFHGILGLVENGKGVSVPYLPSEPIAGKKCPGFLGIGGGEDAGVEYQKLAVATGGLRYPICQYSSFDVVFKAVAMSVITGAKVSCEFDIPKAPGNEEIDLDTIIVNYTSGAGAQVDFGQVKALADCQPGKFYLDRPRNKIVLCPDSCKTVQADNKAKVNVLFDCTAPLM